MAESVWGVNHGAEVSKASPRVTFKAAGRLARMKAKDAVRGSVKPIGASTSTGTTGAFKTDGSWVGRKHNYNGAMKNSLSEKDAAAAKKAGNYTKGGRLSYVSPTATGSSSGIKFKPMSTGTTGKQKAKSFLKDNKGKIAAGAGAAGAVGGAGISMSSAQRRKRLESDNSPNRYGR